RLCCRSPTCYFWTSRPTTWTPSRWRGWNATCRSTPAPWCRSPTTATSSTTSRSGSWNWTAAAASRGRVITRRGWSRNSSGGRRGARARRAPRPRGRGGARWPPGGGGPKRKARLNQYEKLAAQEYEEREDELVLQIPPGPHLGDLVVRAEHVRKGYGDNLLMEDLNFDLPRGGIVGIIGPNGAGKTTLFRMIVTAASGGGGPPHTPPPAPLPAG